jgi:hypothetical protein
MMNYFFYTYFFKKMKAHNSSCTHEHCMIMKSENERLFLICANRFDHSFLGSYSGGWGSVVLQIGKERLREITDGAVKRSRRDA